jgi:N-methylhydantoinase B
MVVPVFAEGQEKPQFFVGNRAHHADVGGTYPGSMGLCREIYQEGVRIPPLKLIRRGAMDRGVLALLLNNVRTPQEREGDLTAQLGACRIGAERVAELAAKYGLARVNRNVEALHRYSEQFMREELRRFPAGEATAEDFLDSDGTTNEPVRIAVRVQTDPEQGTLLVDFAGTARQMAGSLNAVFAITYSAVFYVLRCLLPPEAPVTAGLMKLVTVAAPEGTVVNAVPPAAVAGGNVETSQRIVDVLLRAFAQLLPERIPAASAGTMSNVTIGGIDPRTAKPFAYYETIAGGMGARPGSDGLSGVHTHMTNSLNTPAEALEYAYPLRVRRYAYRRGSGGPGRYRGGDGLVREIELLADAQVTILADRRRFTPYGLQGGAAGQAGKTEVVEKGAEPTELPGQCNRQLRAGLILRIETPGGGGWGNQEK